MSVIEVDFILRFPQVTCDAKSLLSVACLQFHELARDCMQFYKLGKNMHAVPLAFKKLACRCIIMSSYLTVQHTKTLQCLFPFVLNLIITVPERET